MNTETNWFNKSDEDQKCLHNACTECHGSGTKRDGTPCVHFISCPCPKCTPRF